MVKVSKTGIDVDTENELIDSERLKHYFTIPGSLYRVLRESGTPWLADDSLFLRIGTEFVEFLRSGEVRIHDYVAMRFYTFLHVTKDNVIISNG